VSGCRRGLPPFPAAHEQRRPRAVERHIAPTWDEFERLELSVGTITQVEDFPEARAPASKLVIDFGPLGSRVSSAQVTHYAKADLLGGKIVCVLGFPPKRIAGFKSEVLVTGGLSERHGVVLLRPDIEIEPGTPIG
jgi:tRNA-binding protein